MLYPSTTVSTREHRGLNKPSLCGVLRQVGGHAVDDVECKMAQSTLVNDRTSN